MAGLFRTRQPFLQTNSWQNQALNALHYNTSQVGSVVPVIYGTTRQQVNLINFANYIGPQGKKGKSGSLPITGTSNTGKGGGASKGKGGKKGGGDYSIDVDFLICQGPVTFNAGNWVFSSTGVEAFGDSGLNFYTGADGQANDPTFESLGFLVNYSGSCRVTGTPMDLGQSPVIPNLSFEITGFLAGVDVGDYTSDANPANIVVDFLTNARYGAGFPTANIDTLIGGSGFAYGDYCQAAQLLVSISLDGHQTAIEWLAPLVKLTNSAMLWSGKLLKIIPYGDLALSANGATWTPNLTPIYSLTDDDFLPFRARQLGRGPTPGEDDPILTSITNAADVYNWLPIEYTDRSNYYNTTIISVFDQSLIDQYNLRLGDTIQGRAFCNATSAQISAQLQLQRNIFFRATPIKFQAGWQYALVEPMDILLLTGQFGDDYLQETPVRVLSVTENENGDLTFEAEAIQTGQAAPPAVVSEPTYDSSSGAGALRPGTLTLSVTTSKPNDQVVIFLQMMTNPQSVAPIGPVEPYPIVMSISSTNTKNWVRRKQVIVPSGVLSGVLNNPRAAAVEEWIGTAVGTLSSESINVVFTNSGDPSMAANVTAVTAAVVTVNNSSGPDPNPMLPVANTNLTVTPTTPSTPGVSTNNANDVLISYVCNFGSGLVNNCANFSPTYSCATGTVGAQVFQVFDAINQTAIAGYKSLTAPQRGLTAESYIGSIELWVTIADVLTG